mgnify:CR=1 FL=1
MYSIHNHSDFCDGKSTVKEMIESACDKNIIHFGLSGHAPVPFENKWSIKSKEKVKEYCEEIDKYIDYSKSQVQPELTTKPHAVSIKDTFWIAAVGITNIPLLFELYGGGRANAIFLGAPFSI